MRSAHIPPGAPRAASILAMLAALSGCGPAEPAAAPVAAPPPASEVCTDGGPSPFKERDAIHVLVADFEVEGATAQAFAGSVLRGVEAEISPPPKDLPQGQAAPRRAAPQRQHRTRHRPPPQGGPRHAQNHPHAPRPEPPPAAPLLPKEADAPPGSVEIARLRCAVPSHEKAHSIAAALGAGVVIWGSACEGKTPGMACGHATVHRPAKSPRSITRNLPLDEPRDLDLPEISAEDPDTLVHYSLGLALLAGGRTAPAIRYLGQAIEGLPSAAQASDAMRSPLTERRAEAFELPLARALLDTPLIGRSAELSRSALARVEGTKGAAEAGALSALATALMLRNEEAEALPLLRRAAAIREGGRDDRALSTALVALARGLIHAGDADGARAAIDRAIAIDEKALGPAHPDVTFDRMTSGDVLFAKGDVRGAIAIYEASLAADEQTLGAEHPRLAFDHENLGAALVIARDPDAAAHLGRALAILRGSGRAIPREVGPAFAAIAAMHAAAGKLDEAIAAYDDALHTAELAWGTDHPEVAAMHLRAGLLLRKKGDLPGALARMRRALAITEKVRGPAHPEVASALAGIAGVLDVAGDHAGALEHLRRALAIDEKALPPDSLEVGTLLLNIGVAHHASGAFPEAVEAYRRALAIHEKKLGPNHEMTQTIKKALGLAEKHRVIK